MEFKKPYKSYKTLEKNSGEKLVEVAGYITTQQRIENILMAGQRLVRLRKEQFDFHDGEIDENFIAPERSPNFDLVDAQNILNNLEAKQNEARNQHKAESPAIPPQAAPKPPDEE